MQKDVVQITFRCRKVLRRIRNRGRRVGCAYDTAASIISLKSKSGFQYASTCLKALAPPSVLPRMLFTLHAKFLRVDHLCQIAAVGILVLKWNKTDCVSNKNHLLFDVFWYWKSHFLFPIGWPFWPLRYGTDGLIFSLSVFVYLYSPTFAIHGSLHPFVVWLMLLTNQKRRQRTKSIYSSHEFFLRKRSRRIWGCPESHSGARWTYHMKWYWWQWWQA